MITPGTKFGTPVEMVPGSANNIIILARAGKREHLDALQKGKLRASHIGNYKKIENVGKLQAAEIKGAKNTGVTVPWGPLDSVFFHQWII